jgi:hypothetical protein
MREIIFNDSGPRLVFSSTGNLKLVRTGHDGYAEHNNATAMLGRKICAGPGDGRTIADIYRIAHPELVGFVTLPTDTEGVEAVLGVHQPGGHMFALSEAHPMDSSLVLSSLRSFHGDVAASMAWGNFAIGVRGERAVQALTQLYSAIQAGDVALVPSLRSQNGVHGIVLANLTELTDEERIQLNTEPDIFLKQSFSAAKVAG